MKQSINIKQSGNSFKDKYHKEILDNQEIKEVEKLYRIMCLNPTLAFSGDHIKQLFNKDNHASRLFHKLLENDLIKKVHITGMQREHYRVSSLTCNEISI